MNKTDLYCQTQIDPNFNKHIPLFFSGVPEVCDLCNRPIHLGHFFADCKIPHGNAWGYLCQTCIAVHQIKFAWGDGQLYQCNDTDKWRLVAGFPKE